MVIGHVKAAGNFGMHIEFSREDVLLDTGGGLKKAAWFLGESGDRSGNHGASATHANPDEPFILHNVDVISNIDLQRMVEVHKQSSALATLAVQERKTSRYLLFNDQLQLCGRRLVKEEKTEIVRPITKHVRTRFHRHSRDLAAHISSAH